MSDAELRRDTVGYAERVADYLLPILHASLLDESER